jgi:hypothetical protein
MKKCIGFFLIIFSLALIGCSGEKAQEQAQLPNITLSEAEKNALTAYYKDLISVEGIADKAIKVAEDEVVNLIKGGEGSVTLASVIAKAQDECLRTVESLAKANVPDMLPPEAKRLLNEGKNDLVAAYKAHAESFESINTFIAEKSPMALIEYRKRSAHAQELFNTATAKLNQIMKASGVPQ